MSLHPVFRLRSRAGFTLVEVLVVIAVSAVVLGLTVPTSLRFYQNQLVDDTARTLKDTLRRARAYSSAIRNGASYGVKILPGSFVLFQGASYSSRVASEDEAIMYPSNITVTGTVSEFDFSKLYATSTASTTIQIFGDAGTVVIGVNAYGKIELQ